MYKLSIKGQQFYYYSHTDRRCVIQTESNNNPAWKLKFVGVKYPPNPKRTKNLSLSDRLSLLKEELAKTTSEELYEELKNYDESGFLVDGYSNHTIENGRFIVTSIYGKYEKEKVESRVIKGLFEAQKWCDFVHRENPKKTMHIWQIIEE